MKNIMLEPTPYQKKTLFCSDDQSVTHEFCHSPEHVDSMSGLGSHVWFDPNEKYKHTIPYTFTHVDGVAYILWRTDNNNHIWHRLCIVC